MSDARVRKRRASVVQAERYSPERTGEFLLSTAITKADHRRAKKEVRNLA